MPRPAQLGGGMTTDRRTKAMLDEAARRFGKPLSWSQGSYRPVTSYSGSTHAGGGAVDVRTIFLKSRAEKMRLVRALRIVGFAAWYREATPGLWGEHIHAIAIACPDLSRSAQWQVNEYRAGRDGLQGRRPDPDSQLNVTPRTWEKYQRQWPLITARLGAAVWDKPGGRKAGGKRLGRKARGTRVHVLDRRVRGKAVWLRIGAGWIRAKRTSRKSP